MVPLYEFYPSIESFLESTVKHSIDNAQKEVGGLFEPFDLKLLKTLFLTKYIPEIIKGTVENLATLCVDEIDCDKLALKKPSRTAWRDWKNRTWSIVMAMTGCSSLTKNRTLPAKSATKSSLVMN